MTYYDNPNRKRIFGQPADAKGIIEHLYGTGFTVVENGLDDKTKSAFPDFTVYSPDGNFFYIEWQEFHLYQDHIPIKQTKTKYNSPIFNFNRTTGICAIVMPEMWKTKRLRDIGIIPALSKYNEKKDGYFVPYKEVIKHRIPEDKFKKSNINIIACESQQNGLNFYKL